MSEFEKVYQQLSKIAASRDLREALRRASRSYIESFFSKTKKVENLRKVVRAIKEFSIEHLENLVKTTIEVMENKGISVYFAKSSEEALKIFDKIIPGGSLVVKAKSLTSEEISLNEFLLKKGYKVIETDVGEFIVQYLRSRPMHITAPAIHVKREEVAKLLEELTGEKIPAGPQVLVKKIRNILRSKYLNADVGITGANVIDAETGSIFLIENEGNIRLVSSLSRIHVVLAGVEKIVPLLDDAFQVCKVIWRYAGYEMPSYLSIISGLSKTGDIEKNVVVGAQGPKELHVILLDNGRINLSRDPVFKEALYCLRCGACMYFCPIYRVLAGYFGYKYMGGIGAIWTAHIAGGVDKAAPLVYLCTLCERCKEICPLNIDVPRMILKARQMLAQENKVPFEAFLTRKYIASMGAPYRR